MNEVYHVMNKSIAGYVIFNSDEEYNRMKSLLPFYRKKKIGASFSLSTRRDRESEIAASRKEKVNTDLVTIIAYCLMPTHFHMILQEHEEKDIATYISRVLNSYTRYFNLRHKRKGPLWEARSKKVIIENDDILLHITRYIHLNPVTAYLVNKPEDWEFSSYNEYLGKSASSDSICSFKNLLEINPQSYAEFVNDQISYQRELAKIRKLTLDE